MDDRRVLNGIFWVLRPGAPWRDLPSSFGIHDLLQPLCAPASSSSAIRTSISRHDLLRLGQWLTVVEFVVPLLLVQVYRSLLGIQ